MFSFELDPAYLFLAAGLLSGLIVLFMWQRTRDGRQKKKNGRERRPLGRKTKGGRELLPTEESDDDDDDNDDDGGMVAVAEKSDRKDPEMAMGTAADATGHTKTKAKAKRPPAGKVPSARTANETFMGFKKKEKSVAKNGKKGTKADKIDRL